MVKSCAQCQAHQVANTKEPLIAHDVPRRTRHALSTDLFHWNGTEYLLIADFYSKFPIIRKLRNINISDNGPQYTSEEFRVFTAIYGFDHVTSSPMYPRSNGFIERTVQTVNKIFTKVKKSGGDPYLAMLFPRTTTIDHNMSSLCTLLNGRRYKSNLPAVSSRSNGISATPAGWIKVVPRPQCEGSCTSDSAIADSENVGPAQGSQTKQARPDRTTSSPHKEPRTDAIGGIA